MKKKNKNETYVWACDFKENSGEGKLARLFIDFYTRKKLDTKITIDTPIAKYIFNKKKVIKIKKKINKFSSYKYISPFIGLVKIIINSFFGKKKLFYLNYLPIWNFFLFLLLPSRTILGPITGSDFNKKGFSFNNLVRKTLFPLFNEFSKRLIKKKKNLFFSTNLINYKSKGLVKNFQLIYSLNKARYKDKQTVRNIDCLFYYRNHSNKNLPEYYLFLQKLSNEGFNVKICGDKIQQFGSNNLGFLSSKNLKKIMRKSKYALASSENPISFFVQDAVLNGVNLIFDKDNKKLANEYYKNIHYVDFSNIQKSFKIFLNYKKSKTELKKNFLNKLDLRISNYNF